MNRWLPQPMFSLFLWLVWLLLANSLEPGHIVLGAFLALALPLFTVRFWPDQPCMGQPRTLMAYLAVFLWDIVIANLTVARLILGPVRRLRPAFITFPLDLKNDFAITVLAHSLSLTPGTVSSKVSEDRRTLLIHVLDLDDEDQLIQRIKKRYETPLKEIFPC
ncbi:MAG: Na+/H+ antiporter subunit E [Desulfomicrobium sp.]|nr:Na+/H+ antiporter subunit E [Desulfomicrobium sp.]